MITIFIFLSVALENFFEIFNFLEELSSFSEVSITHQLFAVLELSSLLEKSFGVSLLCDDNVRVDVFVHRSGLNLWHVVPVDLELRHTRLFGKDVFGETLDPESSRWIFVEFRGIVLNVDIVANT